jgi:cytochrome c5
LDYKPNCQEKAMSRRTLMTIAAIAAACAALPATATDGKAVWDKACAGCHAALPPKTGDKAAWAPFVKLGAEAVTPSVVKGKGMMPPKGGAANEAEVRAALEYILEQMK